MEAVVVGGVDVGDAHRVVRLLTPTRGRTAFLARGVRGGRKRGLRSLLDAGNVIDVELHRGRGPLPLLTEASPVMVPRLARTDLDRLALLAYGVEICADLAPEDHEATKLYRLLLAWLDRIEADEVPTTASRQALEAKALTFAGLTPALVHCPACGEPLASAELAVFDPDAGGGTHPDHGRGEQVDPRELLRFEALRRTPLADTVGVRPAEPRWLLGDLVRWHLGRAIKSRDLVEELESLP